VQLDVSHALLLGPDPRSGTGKAGASAPGRLPRAYAGEGEAIVDTAERELRILSDHDLANVTWTRHAAGERGAEPHIHKHHTDAFYVLEGEVTFGLGPEPERVVAPAGTLVLVPAGVIHGFDNDGPAEARFLNIHAPGGGFVDSLRGEGKWDAHEPPDDGGRPISDAVVRGPGEGATLTIGPNGLIFKAEVGDGDGTFYLGEMTLAPGFPGPVPHRHAEHLDSFFVLEGTLTLQLGADVAEAPAGSYAVAPPGSVHTFSNPGEGTVRALNIMGPGGFEQYLKEAAAAGTVDPAELAKIASRYDFQPA
jgi:quercetin dioxygenase-like cupin family protein